MPKRPGYRGPRILPRNPARTRRRRAATVIQRRWRRNRSMRTKLKRLTRKVYENTQNAYHDITHPATPIGVSGFVNDFWHLGSITVGDSNIGNRTGNVITVKSMRFKGRLTVAESDVSNVVRLMVIICPCPTGPHVVAPGAPPAVDDILQNTNAMSFLKKNPSVEYTKIYDKTWQLDNNRTPLVPSVSSGSQDYCGVYFPSDILVNINLKFPKGLEIRYDDYSVGTPIPVKNAVYLLAISDSYYGTTIGTHPTLSGYTRMTYTM